MHLSSSPPAVMHTLACRSQPGGGLHTCEAAMSGVDIVRSMRRPAGSGPGL